MMNGHQKCFASFFCSLRHSDNGTFLCHAKNEFGLDVGVVQNLVLDKPQVEIDFAAAVDNDKIYFNWTLSDWNSPVTDYFLSVRKHP